MVLLGVVVPARSSLNGPSVQLNPPPHTHTHTTTTINTLFWTARCECWAGHRLACRSQPPQIPECRHARQAEVETAFAPQPPSVAYVLSLPGKDRDRAFQIRKQCKIISQSAVHRAHDSLEIQVKGISRRGHVCGRILFGPRCRSDAISSRFPPGVSSRSRAPSYCTCHPTAREFDLPPHKHKNTHAPLLCSSRAQKPHRACNADKTSASMA